MYEPVIQERVEQFRRQAVVAVRKIGWLHPHDREGVVTLLETLEGK